MSHSELRFITAKACAKAFAEACAKAFAEACAKACAIACANLIVWNGLVNCSDFLHLFLQ